MTRPPASASLPVMAMFPISSFPSRNRCLRLSLGNASGSSLSEALRALVGADLESREVVGRAYPIRAEILIESGYDAAGGPAFLSVCDFDGWNQVPRSLRDQAHPSPEQLGWSKSDLAELLESDDLFD